MKFSGKLPLLNLAAALTLGELASLGMPLKPLPPASLESGVFVVLSEVVTDQWPATLPLVNSPTDVTLLNPGQCIRVAAIASGYGHVHYFNGASISWFVSHSGKVDSFLRKPVSATKQVRPAQSGFAMDVVGVDAPPPHTTTTATLAVPQGEWCVPQGAADQVIEVQVTVKQAGKETVLQPRKIQIESLETAANKTFQDEKELASFMQRYHVSPEPGRLLPALKFLMTNGSKSAISYTSLKAAFQHDGATVQGFGPLLATAPRDFQVRAASLLAEAEVELREPMTLTAEERKAVAAVPGLPDGYDMKPNAELPARLDLLWTEFAATGKLQPVDAIIGALEWRADFEAYDTLSKAGEKPTELTESMARGLAYSAARGSLSYFQQNDPLAADYIDAIRNDPSTEAEIKAELSHLRTSPVAAR
jgi:hypothetical protein